MPLNPPLDNWKDKIVWVVGASSGIGRATASALHAAGAKVVVSARNQQALDLFVLEHPTSWAIAVDITKAADVQQVAQGIVARHGRLDMVLVCAGHYAPQSALQFDLQEMLRHRAINYDGVLHCIAATLPQLLMQQHGHISFISSVAGYRGLPKALAYGPTKAALQNLADVLYLDLHGQGLGVSVVNPGFVATPLTAHRSQRLCHASVAHPRAGSSPYVGRLGQGTVRNSLSQTVYSVVKVTESLARPPVFLVGWSPSALVYALVRSFARLR